MILVKTDMNMVKSELLHGQYMQKMEFLDIFQCRQNLFSNVTLAFSSLDVLYFLSPLKGPTNDFQKFLIPNGTVLLCTKIGTEQYQMVLYCYVPKQVQNSTKWYCTVMYQNRYRTIPNGIVLYQMVLYYTKWYCTIQQADILQPHIWYCTVPNGTVQNG